MTSDQPDRTRFDAFLSAVATRMASELNQDPKVGLDIDPENYTVRGLLDMADGQPTWLRWPIDWARLANDGPEALAYDFIEDIKSARDQNAVLAALGNKKYQW